MIKKYILKENGVYVVDEDNSNCFYAVNTEEFKKLKKETNDFTLEIKKDIKNEQIKALEQSIAELSMQIAMQNSK